jgi:hypothetical protein
MSFIDYFAWFIRIVLFVSAVAILIAMAAAPGQIAKKRNHLWAEAVEVAGWDTDFRLCALAYLARVGLR